MSRPKFQVGEEIILQSKSSPEYNGEYQVKDIIGPNEGYIGRLGKVCYISTCWSYDLGFEFPHNGDICKSWLESALRKKHKPSDQSLEDMIKEINRSVVS